MLTPYPQTVADWIESRKSDAPPVLHAALTTRHVQILATNTLHAISARTDDPEGVNAQFINFCSYAAQLVEIQPPASKAGPAGGYKLMTPDEVAAKTAEVKKRVNKLRKALEENQSWFHAPELLEQLHQMAAHPQILDPYNKDQALPAHRTDEDDRHNWRTWMREQLYCARDLMDEQWADSFILALAEALGKASIAANLEMQQ